MKMTKLLILGISSFVLVNCTSNAVNNQRLTASNGSLESCYQMQENRIYFSNNGTTPCEGNVFYDGPAGMLMLDVDTFEDGSAIHRHGTPKLYTTKSGDQYFISQWTNGSKANTLIALKIDMAAQKVEAMCTKQNYWSQFHVSETKNGKLTIKIRKPKETGKEYKIGWEEC